MQIHVVEFSPHPPNCVGGWDWFWFRSAARRQVDELMREVTPYDVSYKMVDVPYSEDADEITEMVAKTGVLEYP